MDLRYTPLFLGLGAVLWATMQNPHFFWWFVGLGIIFIILGIGLQHRTRWMWYLGWVVMFLLSGTMGVIFVGGMLKAQTAAELTGGLIYLGVGLAIWVPVAVWWSTHRGSFGKPRSAPVPNDKDSPQN
ncbi:hypothetical protein AYO49_05415 [Verrucomicrobiaceae bacterium SCGC AG-212-N21]|nr:hypothetical protein AYO49_05415 [Verrucomicrobiaceae bacterium SCGC AG-212-N21]